MNERISGFLYKQLYVSGYVVVKLFSSWMRSKNLRIENEERRRIKEMRIPSLLLIANFDRG
jgi:hypothetical protein